VRSILAELKDLPQEAQKIATNIVDLKRENAQLKSDLKMLEEEGNGISQEDIDKEVRVHLDRQERVWMKERNRLIKILENIQGICERELENGVPMNPPTEFVQPPQRLEMHREPYRPLPDPTFGPERTRAISTADVKLGACERRVYTYLRNNTGRGFTKIQLGVITGYSATSGGFNNALSKLRTLGLIQGASGGSMMCGRIDDEVVIDGEPFSASAEAWGPKLPLCERTVYKFLWDHPDEEYTKEFVGDATNYSATSGGFNNALSKLNTLGLIERLPQGVVRLNPDIKDL
jgi:hypothetical protein